jgi:hypothetical protein
MKRGAEHLISRIHYWVRSILAEGMHRQFSGRQRKYKPAAAIIDETKPQNLPEECAICFWVAAIKENMSAANHGRSPSRNLMDRVRAKFENLNPNAAPL